MHRAFKYRLFTNTNQERELAITLETHRRLYNICLDYKQLAYECYKISLSSIDCSRWFTGQRKINRYFANVNFSSAVATMRRLDKSFANFFRRHKVGAAKLGYPRFKSRNKFNSIEYPAYRNGIRLIDGKLYVQHIGTIRIKLHRPIEGTIKTVTLKLENGKWYVIFSCELPDIPTYNTLPAVGIDVGLTHFLTTSDGSQEPNTRYLKKVLPELRIANRTVARKEKHSSNQHKAIRILRKIYIRVRNCRREHHHQVACRLVLNYGLIVAESLNIKWMLKNSKLSRAIGDVAWGNFLNILKHKAEKAGVQFITVDPVGTSQECSNCSYKVIKDLSVRWHDCPVCGLSIDRDQNAAKNILNRGLVRTVPAEVNVNQKVKRPQRSRHIEMAE